MAKYKISVDKKLCIGCGACTVACSNFVMKDDKSVPVKKEVDDIGCNKEAADSCPVEAIKIEEINK
jgi:ferredoxin